MVGLGHSTFVINVTFYKGNFTKHAHVAVEKELHFQPMYGRVNAGFNVSIHISITVAVADRHRIYTVALLIPRYLMKPQIKETKLNLHHFVKIK